MAQGRGFFGEKRRFLVLKATPILGVPNSNNKTVGAKNHKIILRALSFDALILGVVDV